MVSEEKNREKIMQLQLLEQRAQAYATQKQSFQSQLMEIDNALEELKKGKGSFYKIIGPLMVSAKKTDLEKDLKSRRELLKTRVDNIEKQEDKLREEASNLQKELLKGMK